MEIDILFEDPQILVINKPAGLVVMPGPGHEEYQDTLAGWVKNYLGEKIVGVGLPGRWGLVHRLDKDTTGAMVIAKTQEVFEDLVYQFKSKLVKKEYMALVWGAISENQKVETPIGRNPKNPLKFTVAKSGFSKSAQTTFHVVKVFKDASFSQPDQHSREVFMDFALLKAFPETGRTHQIRVHLASLGHPIVGDPLYSGRKKYRWAKNLLGLPRPFLHAQKLEFLHPETSKKVSFEAALPGDLHNVLELLS